jgi:hypothetical protein
VDGTYPRGLTESLGQTPDPVLLSLSSSRNTHHTHAQDDPHQPALSEDPDLSQVYDNTREGQFLPRPEDLRAKKKKKKKKRKREGSITTDLSLLDSKVVDRLERRRWKTFLPLPSPMDSLDSEPEPEPELESATELSDHQFECDSADASGCYCRKCTTSKQEPEHVSLTDDEQGRDVEGELYLCATPNCARLGKQGDRHYLMIDEAELRDANPQDHCGYFTEDPGEGLVTWIPNLRAFRKGYWVVDEIYRSSEYYKAAPVVPLARRARPTAPPAKFTFAFVEKHPSKTPKKWTGAPQHKPWRTSAQVKNTATDTSQLAEVDRIVARLASGWKWPTPSGAAKVKSKHNIVAVTHAVARAEPLYKLLEPGTFCSAADYTAKHLPLAKEKMELELKRLLGNSDLMLLWKKPASSTAFHIYTQAVKMQMPHCHWCGILFRESRSTSQWDHKLGQLTKMCCVSELQSNVPLWVVRREILRCVRACHSCNLLKEGAVARAKISMASLPVLANLKEEWGALV